MYNLKFLGSVSGVQKPSNPPFYSSADSLDGLISGAQNDQMKMIIPGLKMFVGIIPGLKGIFGLISCEKHEKVPENW